MLFCCAGVCFLCFRTTSRRRYMVSARYGTGASGRWFTGLHRAADVAIV